MGKNLSNKWIFEVVTRVGDLDAHAKITTWDYLLTMTIWGYAQAKKLGYPPCWETKWFLGSSRIVSKINSAGGPHEYGARSENDERCAQFCYLLTFEQDRLEFVQIIVDVYAISIEAMVVVIN